MLREIIRPTEPVFTMRLPDEMVGKTVEVIAFEINPADSGKTGATREERIRRIEEITKNTLVDLSNFKFNRDEANNYD